MPATSSILKAVQHPVRRQILQTLNSAGSPVDYSSLLGFVDDSTGKLNYHLRILSGLITKSENGYVISERGRQVTRWVASLEGEEVETLDKPRVVLPEIRPSENLLKKYRLLTIMIGGLAATILLISSIVFTLNISRSVGIFTALLTVLVLAAMWVTHRLVDKYFHSIRYSVTETEIVVVKGIITRTEKIVPFRTVTNIEVHLGPLDRHYQIGTLEIQTAGSSSTGPEEKLVGLDEPFEVKSSILEYIRLLNPPKFMGEKGGEEGKRIEVLAAVHEELRSLNQELEY